MAASKSNLSPLMQQYYQIKAQHPDCIMFFRVGDFYETFGEDAVVTSKVLGLVLTRKASGGGAFTELAGVPHHAIDVYLPKMVKAGYKVAVCDQLEDPKLTKTLVKRGITELVTPGVSFNDGLLTGGENNWLAACFFEQHKAGVAFLDISTGTFKVAEGDRQYVDILISDFAPKEVLLQHDILRNPDSEFAPLVEHIRHSHACITPMQEWAFSYSSARARLLAQFKTTNLKGFGIEELQFATVAASAILSYLEMTEHTSLDHIRSISRIDRDDFVWIDRFTFRNLEIFAPLVQEGTSLLQVMDRCCCPMGSRLMREWIAMPLKDTAAIARRQDVVESLHDNPDILAAVRTAIADVGDLERMMSKAAVGRISPREVLALANGLRRIAEIVGLTAKLEKVAALSSGMDGCSALCDLIEHTVTPQAAAQLGKGDVIAEGVDEELDNFRNTLSHSKEILLDIQATERERTGISSLKISYNNVFGYYLEVRNTHADKVPEDWIRKQTLVNAERYITPQLKEYEQTIMGAEERILAIESRIFGELVAAIQQNVAAIQRDALLVAQIDCLASFAFLAAENGYCRPTVDNSLDIDIKAGRHPVIETMMEPGSEYVANDLAMSNDGTQIIILTGPNMSGKSALLRQTALIMLMAQVGSFVPAASARLGYIDKLFTRVGASDNISRGESTFMVEMSETATILNNLSQRSLVLLDEIGRGTSTYDGMSIAWAIVSYLHEFPGAPKTLFATHYHELNELENIYERVHDFHIATREAAGQVIFLRKLTPGGVASSFGIHVARMAGVPAQVVAAAEKKLRTLESEEKRQAAASSYGSGGGAGNGNAGGTLLEEPAAAPIQLSLYQLDDPLLAEIRDILEKLDLNSMSPLDAFDTIRAVKAKLGGGK